MKIKTNDTNYDYIFSPSHWNDFAFIGLRWRLVRLHLPRKNFTNHMKFSKSRDISPVVPSYPLFCPLSQSGTADVDVFTEF